LQGTLKVRLLISTSLSRMKPLTHQTFISSMLFDWIQCQIIGDTVSFCVKMLS